MPKIATPKLKQLARRLLAYEVASTKPSAPETPPAFHVFKKFHGPFAKLMGTTGFRALMARALGLAKAEVPWLGQLQIKDDGSVEGLDKLEGKKAPVIAAGEVALVAQLVGLLMTFIGEELTMRLLHEIWPQLKNEKF